MTLRLPNFLLGVLLAAMAGAPATAAAADPLADLVAAHLSGTFDPCDFTTGELRRSRQQLGRADAALPGLDERLASAIAARAAGACAGVPVERYDPSARQVPFPEREAARAAQRERRARRRPRREQAATTPAVTATPTATSTPTATATATETATATASATPAPPAAGGDGGWSSGASLALAGAVVLGLAAAALLGLAFTGRPPASRRRSVRSPGR